MLQMYSFTFLPCHSFVPSRCSRYYGHLSSNKTKMLVRKKTHHPRPPLPNGMQRGTSILCGTYHTDKYVVRFNGLIRRQAPYLDYRPQFLLIPHTLEILSRKAATDTMSCQSSGAVLSRREKRMCWNEKRVVHVYGTKLTTEMHMKVKPAPQLLIYINISKNIIKSHT